MIMRAIRRYPSDERGASAAEFALVTVPFVALTLGIIGLGMALYANQCLQYATEAAARYYSVQTANAGGTERAEHERKPAEPSAARPSRAHP